MRLRYLLFVLAAVLLVPSVAWGQGGQVTLIQSSTEPLPNCTPAVAGQLQPQIWDVTAQQMKTCTAPNTWSQMGGGGGGVGSGTQYAVTDWATSSTLGSIFSTQFGDVLQFQNGAAPIATVQGLPLGNAGVPVTSCPYTIAADTSTSILDRGTVLVFNSASSCAVTLDDPATSGMGTNFPVKMVNFGAGTVTVSRQSAATFSIATGGSVTTSATSFTLTTGQYITLHNDSNTTWWGEQVSGGGTACATIGGNAYYAAVGSAISCDGSVIDSGTGTLNANAFDAVSDGVHAGLISLIGNTTNPAIPSNTVNWVGPALASFTAYGAQLPSTGPSGAQPLVCGTPSSSVSACSFTNTVTIANLLISTTAPTIAAAGCGGAVASIPHNNGTAAFTVNIGTSNTGACTITMPTATNGWACHATNLTTKSATQATVLETSASSATSLVLQNYGDTMSTHAMTDSDILIVECSAY